MRQLITGNKYIDEDGTMSGSGCKCEVKCTDSTMALQTVRTCSRSSTSGARGTLPLERPSTAPHHHRRHRPHSQLHPIHHRQPGPTGNSHKRPAVSSSVPVDRMLSSQSHIIRLPAHRVTRFLLTWALFAASFCLPPPIQGTESNRLHHTSHHHSKHKPPTLSTLLTFTELITADSIYPCLDTFDVVLMRSTDGLAKQHEPKGKPAERYAASDQNQTRQLVRVYWATKEVVDGIVSATAQHLSTDRLYPSQPHRGHRRGHHRAHHWPHYQHQHSLRPSMLIELRQLNYVREYALPVKSQLVRMRCDIFEPNESIYYCFIYVILYRHAVFFESLPYCVPTTLSDSDQQTAAAASGGKSRINELNKRPAFAAYPKLLIDPHGTDDLIADMDVIGRANDSASTRKFLNDDHGQLGGNYGAVVKTRTLENDKQPDELEQIRSMILPPGPAYEKARREKASSLLSDSDYADAFRESDNSDGGVHSTADSNEKDANIRQFALKSADQSDYDAERRRSAAGAKRRKKVLIQTRSCYCAGQSAAEHSVDDAAAVGGRGPSSTLVKQGLVRINLTASETTVLHLIITSCPAAVDEWTAEAADESAESGLANYRANDSNETLHNGSDDFSEVPLDATNQLSVADGGLLKQHSSRNGRPKKQRKGKGKKGKGGKMKGKEMNPELPSATESPPPPTSTASSSTSTTTIRPSTSTTERHSLQGSTSSPTVCILAIDNPSEYSFKLDSIEPSMEWPVSEASGLDFTSTIDLINYLHQFPLLVVRNGQFSIDPRMNIENRSQTHYLRSSHLRFEAQSSINVTLRFRRSAASSLARDHRHRVTAKQSATEGGWSSAIATMRSIVDSTVSYIAYKVVNTETHEDSQLTAFHVISMLLSLFILATLVIFAVIALMAHHATPTRQRVVQICTPDELNPHQFSIEDGPSADCSLMAPSGSNQTADELANRQLKSPISKGHDSLGSFEGSLEMDYYDYAVPLMVHSSSGIVLGTAEKHAAATSGGDTSCRHTTSYRRSLEAHSPAFRTLPIKVNSPNRKINSANNTSMCSLTLNGASPPSHLINDAQSIGPAVKSLPSKAAANGSPNNIATLARLSFTKPPVLLSTFGRNDGTL